MKKGQKLEERIVSARDVLELPWKEICRLYKLSRTTAYRLYRKAKNPSPEKTNLFHPDFPSGQDGASGILT